MTEKPAKKKKSRAKKPKADAKRTEEQGSPADMADQDKNAVDPDETIAVSPAAEEAPKDEVSVLKNQLLRLQADFENYRKRMARERSDIYKRANEELIDGLLPVIDHMDLALQSALPEGECNAFVEGFRMIQDQLCETLAKSGLSAIEAEGKSFDPNLHEAVAHMPSDEVEENGVMAQTRRGFMLGGRLLRASQVVVSSGSAVVESASVTDVGDVDETDAEEDNNAGEA